MHSLSLQTSSDRDASINLEAEVARLDALLEERRAELASLQERLREFRARYTQIVGSRMSELSDLERAIKEAEDRLLGLETEEAASEETESDFYGSKEEANVPVRKALRKLFWSVAKMFHPDHASDEREARRRHTVMAEANRAYREGDLESLNTLLGDEGLQSFCASVGGEQHEEEDLSARLLTLELEIRTIEFGIKRIHQDALYKVKLKVEEEESEGRDALAQMAASLDRKIAKARRRLEHLS